MGDLKPQLPAQTIYLPPPTPVAVVSPQFIAHYPVDLRITKKFMTIGTYLVTDVKNTVMLKIERSFFSLSKCRVVTDGTGDPIVNFQPKLCTLHKRWLVYRGTNRDSKDLLFTIRKPSVFQWSVELDVILGSNTIEGACDFKIKKNAVGKYNYTVFLGDGTTDIAHLTQINPHRTNTFEVKVYPNVDYAFIVSLGVILYKLLRRQMRKVAGPVFKQLFHHLHIYKGISKMLLN